jgi:hypothetical protein
MHRISPLLLLLAACGPSEHTVARETAPDATPADTARRDGVRGDPTIEAVRERLDRAERDAAVRRSEALDAAEPR